jgi:ATP-grasp domain
MNYISISPHFPPNYIPFCVNLRKMGVNVLGLADASYDELRPDLKAVLTEYYRVSNMNNYDEKVRALGYFTYRYGKLDRLESHNEYWLESDARLRTDFNIPGLKCSEVDKMKRKSEMKGMFKKARIRYARGQIVKSLDEACSLVDEVGFPIVVKPDIGVGANKTYKIANHAELEQFFINKSTGDTIIEEFISGYIQTFDGLTNQNGEIVFCNSLHFSEGVMDLVNQNLDFWYYTQRSIPADVEAAGRRLVAAYQLRERFFHFEFFRTPEGKLVGLEVNMRPPGGLTTDMFNYANDIDIYYQYANVVVNNRFDVVVKRPYFCAYVGRRKNKIYLHAHNELLNAFPRFMVHHEAISGVFAPAIGDYGYLIRSPDLDELNNIAEWILQKP